PYLQAGLERLGIVAVDAARLFQVNLEPRAVRGHVVARAPQADRRVEHVLAPGGAALLTALAGMMDDQNRNAAPSQAQEPILNRAPALGVVVANDRCEAAEVVEDEKID